jgi:hypothetical protein
MITESWDPPESHAKPALSCWNPAANCFVSVQRTGGVVPVIVISPLVILRTPTDIFPNINIPVVSVLWNYTGLNAEERNRRATGESAID